MKILIVDDLPENLLALSSVLSDGGYEVWEAGSGAKALALAEEHDFAAILLDVQMPVMDGFETARRLRQKSRSRATPLIYVTAIHRDETFEYRGYGEGAVDYLFKPLNTDILRAKIGVFAELFRKNEENLRQAELLKQTALQERENQLLKFSLEARDEFLAMASHELKTPMTPLNLQMQAFLEMYRDGSVSEVSRERLIRMLEASQAQVDRLSRLINDLVDLTRLSSGKIELRPESTELGSLVRDLIADFAGQAEQAGCEVRLKIDPGIFGLWDKFRVEQAVVNVLTNALKYGAGRPVDVRVGKLANFAYVHVKDQGIGIAAEDHERIFQRFERAVSGRNYGGLGLGLYIARHLVELHHGRISVSSSPGEGAAFTIELPL